MTRGNANGKTCVVNGVKANSHEDYAAGLGKSVGRWLSLQMSEDNLKQALGEIEDGNGTWEVCSLHYQ